MSSTQWSNSRSGLSTASSSPTESDRQVYEHRVQRHLAHGSEIIPVGGDHRCSSRFHAEVSACSLVDERVEFERAEVLSGENRFAFEVFGFR